MRMDVVVPRDKLVTVAIDDSTTVTGVGCTVLVVRLVVVVVTVLESTLDTASAA